MREQDDGRAGGQAPEVVFQPLQLVVAQQAQTPGLEVQHVDEANQTLGFFQSRRNEAPPLAILDELTRLVPTDSWVKQLTVHGRTVEIGGNSPRASDLVSRVEGSAIFENPRFRSPITLAPDGKSERFDLSLDIKGERLP